ncbi:DedA family protein (plasmid) [Pseudalkalibacillus hwajinpoensis]|uniref:DedA family protein n=1 Tax=Guptibacillus hwajinpoensis TaxID=208199 RepID=UPI00325ADEBF
MGSEELIQYILSYGYFIIFLFLFFGIVGIPAPEESLLFLVGLLASNEQLMLSLTLVCTFLGVYSGMVTGFYGGRFIGSPLIERYGRWIGLTKDRVQKYETVFKKHSTKTLLLGIFLPGLRQLIPYLAGIFGTSHVRFLSFTIAGSAIWTISYVLLGYWLGTTLSIDPSYVPYAGVGLLLIFILTTVWGYVKKKRER